ncbi:MAG: FHA domain-containing protein [Anaerolineae bacterium]
MIECPSCGHKHRPGTLFCTECGVYLPSGGPLGTEPIPEGDLPAARVRGWQSDSAGEGQQESPAALSISVPSSGRQIPVPSAKAVEVGRLDAAHGIFPDVDLAPDGGLEGGVSRRHCKICYQEGRYLVEDLGSANGTFLNGKRLTPYLTHALENGDELQLGRVRLRVMIQD